MQELTNEKVLAEGDLNRLLGTLRYLQSLKAAREKVESAPEHTGQASYAPCAGEGRNGTL